MSRGVLLDVLNKSRVEEVKVNLLEDGVRVDKGVEGDGSSEGVLVDVEVKDKVIGDNNESDSSFLVVEEDGEVNLAESRDGFTSKRDFEGADSVCPGDITVVDSEGTLVDDEGEGSELREGLGDHSVHGHGLEVKLVVIVNGKEDILVGGVLVSKVLSDVEFEGNLEEEEGLSISGVQDNRSEQRNGLQPAEVGGLLGFGSGKEISDVNGGLKSVFLSADKVYSLAHARLVVDVGANSLELFSGLSSENEVRDEGHVGELEADVVAGVDEFIGRTSVDHEGGASADVEAISGEAKVVNRLLSHDVSLGTLVGHGDGVGLLGDVHYSADVNPFEEFFGLDEVGDVHGLDLIGNGVTDHQSVLGGEGKGVDVLSSAITDELGVGDALVGSEESSGSEPEVKGEAAESGGSVLEVVLEDLSGSLASVDGHDILGDEDSGVLGGHAKSVLEESALANLTVVLGSFLAAFLHHVGEELGSLEDVIEGDGFLVVESGVLDESGVGSSLGGLLSEEVEVGVEGDVVHLALEFDLSLDVVVLGVEDHVSQDVSIDGESDEVLGLGGLLSVLDFLDFSGLSLGQEGPGGVADVEGVGLGVVLHEDVLGGVGVIVDVVVVVQLEELDDSAEAGLGHEDGGVVVGSQGEVLAEEGAESHGNVVVLDVELNVLGGATLLVLGEAVDAGFATVLLAEVTVDTAVNLGPAEGGAIDVHIGDVNSEELELGVIGVNAEFTRGSEHGFNGEGLGDRVNSLSVLLVGDIDGDDGSVDGDGNGVPHGFFS